MRVLVVKSTSAPTPLCEIRTDGKLLDFIVDNTDGALPEATQGSYERLINMVRRSSHLTIEEPKTPVAHLLRYLMDNGDVVEITTDGKTCLLNGRLLGDDQKNALFAAISRGEINVSQKADINKPVPVMPVGDVREPVKQQRNNSLRDGIKTGLIDALTTLAQKRANSNEHYDYDIENMDLSNSPDPHKTKSLAYAMKYGTSRRR